MGMGFDSCCGPKTSDEHTLAAETNGTGTAASDAELIDGPSGRSRGSKLRIGQRFSHKDDDGEEHLESHKQPRDKSDKTVELLKKAVKQDRVGGVLEDSQIEYIVRRMEYYTFQREEIVVEQGKVGTIFFVCEVGTMEVSVDGTVCNTLQPGLAFGGLALLYNCPRTATVKALSEVGVWGANGKTFRQVLQENAQARYRENRPFMEKIQIFDGLATKQKDKVAELFSTEVTENNARVLTEGHAVTAIYFVKEGQLRVWKGGSVDENGALVGGTETGSFQTGECFGDQAMYNSSPCSFTVLASGRCELLCISVEELKEVLGDDLKQCLEKSLVLQGLKQSPYHDTFLADAATCDFSGDEGALLRARYTNPRRTAVCRDPRREHHRHNKQKPTRYLRARPVVRRRLADGRFKRHQSQFRRLVIRSAPRRGRKAGRLGRWAGRRAPVHPQQR